MLPNIQRCLLRKGALLVPYLQTICAFHLHRTLLLDLGNLLEQGLTGEYDGKRRVSDISHLILQCYNVQ